MDGSESSCSRCGATRPQAGWLPISGIRPDESPGIKLDVAPVEADEEALVTPQREEIPEAVFDFARPMGVPVGIRTARVATVDEPETPAPAQPLRIRVGPRGEPRSEDRPAETLEAGDYAGGTNESDDARLYSGRYWIEETLSASAAAARYRAVQEPAVRRVVLTVLGTQRPEEVQLNLESRFLRDARLLARIRHPSLAPVHDAGRSSDGTCFATEEVLYGSTFRDLVAAKGIPPEALLTIAVEVTGALGAMHEAGVVHRSLSGDAVVVPALAGNSTREPTQLGHYGWHVLPEDLAVEEDVQSLLAAAPEVLAGQEPDELSDIYAIGALLYLALAGHPTYPGTAAEVRAAALLGPPAALPATHGLAAELGRVTMRCLAVRPEDRWPTARSLLTTLQALAAPAQKPVPAVVMAVPPARFPYGWAAIAVVGTSVPSFALMMVLTHPFAPPPVVAPASTAAVAGVPPAAAVATVPAEAPGRSGGSPASAPVAVPEVAVSTPVAKPVQPASAPAAPRSAPSKPTVAPSPVARKPVDAPAEPVDRSQGPSSTVLVSQAPPPELAPPPPVVAPVVTVVTPAVAVLAPVTPAAPAVPGAAALTGLWLGKAPGATVAFDLTVSADGRVTGRARRSDNPGEAAVAGRVKQTEAGLQVDLQVTEGGATQTYSGLVADGALAGRVYDGGKSVGRFNAKR